MELYKFENLRNFLKKILPTHTYDYESLVEEKNIKIGGPEDIREEKIIFHPPPEIGITFIDKGNKKKGFVYDKFYRVNYYDKFPKMHIFKCETIQKFINRNTFFGYYYWSNQNSVTIIDRDTREKYNNVSLQLCYNCNKILKQSNLSSLNNSKDYRKKLLQDLLLTNDKKIENGKYETNTDLNGYPFNWKDISLAYRELNDFTCESCGFSRNNFIDKKDKEYIDTHHIDGNKLNTHSNNLKSLCKLCHYHQDDHHQSNFENPRMKRGLLSFVRKYKEVLKEIGNPYIDTFIQKFKNEL